MAENMQERIWKTKVAAWVHDPVTKALILFRTGKGGHENSLISPVRRLRDILFGGELEPDIRTLVERADHWAAGADRPQLPREKGEGRFPSWLEVDFFKEGELRHPMDGTAYELSRLEQDFEHIEEVTEPDFEHLAGLVVTQDDGSVDWERTLLSLWRFGPEFPPENLGLLWQNLPADTRVPDHSIWSHLRLTSALAGASVDDEPALVVLSLAPVQAFIAQARKTTDLWAGSHLLSRMSWEAMKVFVEAYGPDSLILPNLWGVPLVDMWLAADKQVPSPEGHSWRDRIVSKSNNYVLG